MTKKAVVHDIKCQFFNLVLGMDFRTNDLLLQIFNTNGKDVIHVRVMELPAGENYCVAWMLP